MINHEPEENLMDVFDYTACIFPKGYMHDGRLSHNIRKDLNRCPVSKSPRVHIVYLTQSDQIGNCQTTGEVLKFLTDNREVPADPYAKNQVMSKSGRVTMWMYRTDAIDIPPISLSPSCSHLLLYVEQSDAMQPAVLADFVEACGMLGLVHKVRVMTSPTSAAAASVRQEGFFRFARGFAVYRHPGPYEF